MNTDNPVYFDQRMVTSNLTYNKSGGRGNANTGNYSDDWHFTVLADMDANDTFIMKGASHSGSANSVDFLYGSWVMGWLVA
jgi:hypothetical protein